jgi:hypothetical protein
MSQRVHDEYKSTRGAKTKIFERYQASHDIFSIVMTVEIPAGSTTVKQPAEGEI